MTFEIIGDVVQTETIATGRGISDLTRLKKQYGEGRWRKRKGIARIRLADGTVRLGEIHWYEAPGIGNTRSKRFSELKRPTP